MFPKKSLALISCAQLFVFGCSTMQETNSAIETANTNVSKLSHEIKKADTPILKISEKPFVLAQKIETPKESDPSDAVLSRHVVLSTSSAMSLPEIAMFVTEQTGVPVLVSPAIAQRNSSGNDSGKPNVGAFRLPAPSGADTTNPAATLPAPLLLFPSKSLPGISSNGLISLNYSGTLRGLFDTLAAQSNTFWKYKDGKVLFYLTETRIFEVSSLPGKLVMSNSISNSGGKGGENSAKLGDSAQSAEVGIELDPYKTIEEAIKTVLKQSGASQDSISSVTVDPNSGQVVVTATPVELDAVEEYIRNINAQMGKNVLIEVNVYSVTLEKQVDLGAAIQAEFSRLSSSGNIVGFSLDGGALASTTGNASIGIISGNFSAQAMLSALSKVGRASLVTSGNVIALNGRPSPIQFSRNEGYLAEVQSTAVSNAGVSTSLTPGKLVTGFSGTFLPLVRGKKIFLEYALSISKNLGFRTETSGNNKINLPNTTLQTVSNRVSLKDGDTIVLTSFSQEENSANDSAGTSLFGVGRSQNKTATVITMRVVNLGG